MSLQGLCNTGSATVALDCTQLSLRHQFKFTANVKQRLRLSQEAFLISTIHSHCTGSATAQLSSAELNHCDQFRLAELIRGECEAMSKAEPRGHLSPQYTCAAQVQQLRYFNYCAHLSHCEPLQPAALIRGEYDAASMAEKKRPLYIGTIHLLHRFRDRRTFAFLLLLLHPTAARFFCTSVHLAHNQLSWLACILLSRSAAIV